MGELTITDNGEADRRQSALPAERLSVVDGILLYRSPDLRRGWLANHIREKRHGNITYFNVNRHINPTNVCVAHCKLCAFGRDLECSRRLHFRTRRNLPARRTRCSRRRHRISHRPPPASRSTFDYYLEMVRGRKQRCPTIHRKAFTMVEVHFFSRIAKISVEEVLQKMKGSRRGLLPRRRRRFSIRVCARLSAITKPADRCGSTPRERLIRPGYTPTPPCSTATSRPKKSASITL